MVSFFCTTIILIMIRTNFKEWGFLIVLFDLSPSIFLPLFLLLSFSPFYLSHPHSSHRFEYVFRHATIVLEFHLCTYLRLFFQLLNKLNLMSPLRFMAKINKNPNNQELFWILYYSLEEHYYFFVEHRTLTKNILHRY